MASGWGLFYRWDKRKAAINLRKHGVTFEEAATTFSDPLSITVPDHKHSNGEQRLFSIGRSWKDRLIAVVHTETENEIRIISARKTTRKEAKAYEEGEEY
jgi:uncharacterized DUF497 family protein